MIKLFVLVVLLLCLSEAGRPANPGVKVALSKSGLNFAAEKAVEIMSKKIPSVKFPSISGKKFFRYEIKDIKVTSFKAPSASVTLNPGSGLTLKLTDGALGLYGRWGIKFIFFWLRGGITATSSDIDLELTVGVTQTGGKPVIHAQKCNAHLGGFKIKTSGSILSWLINLIISLFNNTIKKIVQREVCKAIVNVINKNANEELKTFNLVAKITKDVQLDYSLTSNPVFTSTYMASFHKGKFLFDPKKQLTPGPMEFRPIKMVRTSISAETLNSLGRVLHVRKLFDYRLNIDKSVFEELLGENLPKDFAVKLHVRTISAPRVNINPDKLTVNVGVQGEFLVDEMVLKIEVQASGDCVVKVEKDRIKGSLSSLKLEVKVLENSLPFPLPDEKVNELAKAVAPLLLPTINSELDKGIPLPKVTHVTFSGYVFNLANQHIQVVADVS